MIRHRRYLYRADPASDYDGDAKHAAELWAFAAAILPRINECSADVAHTLRANSDIEFAPVSAGFVAVKEELEGVYACLGMTCDQVRLRTTGMLVVCSCRRNWPRHVQRGIFLCVPENIACLKQGHPCVEDDLD